MADHTFRLNNTSLGTVLVKFYRVVPYTPEGLQRRLTTDFWLMTEPGKQKEPWRMARYQGLLEYNPVLPEAVATLAKKCPECNCVRIE
jgi:hypothetical protein